MRDFGAPTATNRNGGNRTADDDALRPLVPQHGVVGGVGHGEDVRRQLAQPPVLVQLDVLGVVDRVELERVDGDQDRADVRVDVVRLRANHKPPFTPVSLIHSSGSAGFLFDQVGLLLFIESC